MSLFTYVHKFILSVLPDLSYLEVGRIVEDCYLTLKRRAEGHINNYTNRSEGHINTVEKKPTKET